MGDTAKIIYTPNAPAPIGPYSQAVQAGGFLFLSGQVAIDPASGTLDLTSIEMETHRVIANIRAVLGAAGLTLADVVKTTIFLTDLGNFTKVNTVYEEYFGETRPARSTVEVKALPKGVNIEIECIAKISE